MKVEVFATLDAVLRTGSFAAAALERNLTPSSVSLQMKQLEGHIGKPLFDRSGLQVRPLPLAHEVAAAMRPGLQQFEVLRQKTSVSVEGSVRLGIIASMVPILLPGVLPLVRANHPKLFIRPCSGRSASLIEAVKAGTLDAAIAAQPDKGGSSRLRWEPLERRELLLLAPPGSRGRSLNALFKRFEWIRHDRSTMTGRMAARYINHRVREKRGTLELDNAAAIVAMVSAGLGVSMLQLSEPASVFGRYPVRVIRLADAPVLQIALVTRQVDRDKRALAAVKDAVFAVSAATARERLDLAGY